MSVSGRSSDVDFSPSSQERMNFKWAAAFSEIEVVDGKFKFSFFFCSAALPSFMERSEATLWLALPSFFWEGRDNWLLITPVPNVLY